MAQITAPALPSGTLTFLFTDIEGSTRLVQELGPEAYGDVLERHRELLRAAWAAHDGIEVGTEGDSFFVVFASAPAAVAAAVDAQRALAATEFPHGVRPIQVRMGLHTGLGRGQRRHVRRRGRQPGRRGSRQPPTAARSSCHRPRCRCSKGACRTGSGPATWASTGSRTSGPSTSTILEIDGLAERPPPDPLARQPAEQPADPGHLVRRSGGRAGGDHRAAGDDPAADPDRSRRNGQDPPVAPAGRLGRGRSSPTGCTSWPSSRSASRPSSARRSPRCSA